MEDMSKTAPDEKQVSQPPSENRDSNEKPAAEPNPPVKIRKKPGRKPNPQSPAIRKAQNRAAQRAFRERKERHLRELEVALKQIKDQRDRVIKENNTLKTDNDIYRAENWYLKGIVLTLQLVCYQNNLVIPQHSPYLNEPALSIMAQSMPESISAYLDVNAHNTLPIPSKLVEPIATPTSEVPSLKFANTPRERSDSIASNHFPENSPTNPSLSDDLSFDIPTQNSQTTTVNPSGLGMFPNERQSINIPELETKDLDPMLSNPGQLEDDFYDNMDMDDKSWSDASHRRSSDASFMSKLPPSPPPLQPSFFDSKVESGYPTKPPPSPPPTCRHSPAQEVDKPPPMSAIAAIQAIRLKLRLRLITENDKILPPHVQPTILQLSIPHDPRIDLIPTAHMRDRMIIFRDQFDMDDCFNMLITRAVFHGGDPGDASSWELPADFFERYWFLTINYDLKRTNRWRRLQGLNELHMFENVIEPFLDTAGGNAAENQNRDSEESHSSLNHHFDSVMVDTDHSRSFAPATSCG